jgi:hypothetical protein
MPGTAIGNILGAFAGPGTIKYQTVDPALAGRIGNIWSEYDTSADQKNNAAYLSAYAANTPQAGKIAQGNLGFLNQYATGAYDPTKSYGDILNLNQKALGSFLIDPALNELTRQRKMQQAAAGYGGQGAGAYDQLLQSRTLQQLASQAVPNLLGNTTAAYGTAGRLGQENFLNRMGIIGSGEQYRQLDTPALRYLEPTRLARSDVQANLANLGSIAKQQDLNRAYYRKPDSLETWSRALNEGQAGLVSEANDYLSLYEKAQTGGVLGGGGGGGFGGFGGGGGGGAPAGAAAGAGAGGQFGKFNFAGGAGGGGGNQAMMNQALQAYRAYMAAQGGGGGVQQSPYQSSYPYPVQGDYFGTGGGQPYYNDYPGAWG